MNHKVSDYCQLSHTLYKNEETNAYSILTKLKPNFDCKQKKFNEF